MSCCKEASNKFLIKFHPSAHETKPYEGFSDVSIMTQLIIRSEPYNKVCDWLISECHRSILIKLFHHVKNMTVTYLFTGKEPFEQLYNDRRQNTSH